MWILSSVLQLNGETWQPPGILEEDFI